MRLTITSVAYLGSGIARTAEGMVVFVPGSLPGETVEATIVKRAKRFMVASVDEILEASPDRIKPDCRLPSGVQVPGCVYDHASYSCELRLKAAQLQDFLRPVSLGFATSANPVPSDNSANPVIGVNPVNDVIGVNPITGVTPVNDVIGINAVTGVNPTNPLPPSSWRPYRNKMVLHYRRGALGYVGEDNQTIIDIAYCPLSLPQINYELARVRASEHFRNGDKLTIRYTSLDGAVSWVNNPPPDLRHLREKTAIGPMLVPTDGFFQINPFVSRELVRQVTDWAKQGGEKEVLDLYCGVGVFALHAMLQAGFIKATGIESGRHAVAAAEENARAFGVAPGATFICSDAVEAARQGFFLRDLSHTLVIVDPPRMGLGRPVSEALRDSGAPRIIYVSCDPATLARDLRVILRGGYAIEAVRMFDMFPRTAHFETAVLLRRNSQ